MNSSPASSQTSRSSCATWSPTRFEIARTCVDVELHAGALHLDEHLDERQLDVVQQARSGRPPRAAARWRSASTRAITARSATPSAPSTSAPIASSIGQLVERVAAPRRVDQVGGHHRVVRERRRRAVGLRGGERLPVVRHERPLAPGQRHRGQRLGLPHEHLVVAGIDGEAQRAGGLAPRRAARPRAAAGRSAASVSGSGSAAAGRGLLEHARQVAPPTPRARGP